MLSPGEIKLTEKTLTNISLLKPCNKKGSSGRIKTTTNGRCTRFFWGKTVVFRILRLEREIQGYVAIDKEYLKNRPDLKKVVLYLQKNIRNINKILQEKK